MSSIFPKYIACLANLLHIPTRKMVPITGRASSFLVFLDFQQKSNREEGRQNNRPINLLKVITFSMDNKYTT